MTYRVGTKGQVVIPLRLRQELAIEPGDEISFWREGDQVVLRPVRGEALRGRFAGADLVGELERERSADRRRES